ncbi:hypothetical protein [Nocardioides ferulae]|uniref:hypothetical protein n=1 Tax=Nocardioides ferulae TaxID=2340821 RepID=UPI000EB29379|nr:hypothetical protein [Nocardioides ferulae]
MENTPDELRSIERAEAAPFVDYPPTPRWYYPAAGAWFAGITATQGLTDDHLAISMVLLVLLLVAFGVFMGWYSRYRGAMPRFFARTPREMRATFLVYFAGVAAVLGSVWWTLAEVGWAPASALMFVLATTGLWLHERNYEAAAARVRSRLS